MVCTIYLDYAATTPLDPRVTEKMLPYLHTFYGNPASQHTHGFNVKKAIDIAREQLAALLHAEPSEFIWTSGATEANNLALKGVAELYQRKGKHIITLKTEHISILDTCQYLEKHGFQVTYLTPKKNGLLDFDEFHAALRKDTILVSIMHVNNEIGVIQDIKKIAEITASRGILLHVDAAQSVGKIELDLSKIAIDLVSISAHKFYGPQGIGALYLRRKPRVRVAPQMHGGGQEQGMRSGTLPVHQIVGLGAACEIAQAEMHSDEVHNHTLRAQLLNGIQKLHPILTIDHEAIYPGILSFRFENIPAKFLLEKLSDLSFSTSSACHANSDEPSHVLRALGWTSDLARTGVRFSFGRFTTLEQINYVIEQIFSSNYSGFPEE